MTTESITAAWLSLSTAAKLGIVAGIFALLVLVGGGVGGVITRYHDSKFDKAEAKSAEERAELELDRDAALRRAEAAEARASVIEQQVAALTELATEKGKTAAQKQAAADKIAAQVDEAVRAVVELPHADAEADIKERLRRLGYLK